MTPRYASERTGRPILEELERRLLLSTNYLVTSLVDVIDTDGEVTLREAIQAANSDAAVNEAPAGDGADIIEFGSALFTPDSATILLQLGQMAITDSLTITVPDSKDLTISGLGIINNIDIVNDAASALAGLEAAVAEIDDYADHLESKAGDLESAAAVLDVQSQSLLAVSSAIESADAAMMLVNALNNNYTVQADLFLVAQANLNLMTDTVLRLLAD